MSQIFIDGAFCDAATSALREVTNPANSKSIGSVAECAPIDLDLAVRSAQGALAQWSSLNEDDRYTALQAVAHAVTERRTQLTDLLVTEGGLTQREARASIDAALLTLRYPPAGGRPVEGSVRAIFGPSSSPILPIVRQITAALMAGDTVVVVPPFGAALANLQFAQAWAELPAGVVNIVTGDRALAQALAHHDGIQTISFTGSAAVASSLLGTGRALTSVVGAADAAIVRADANLDLAVRALAWSRLRHGGRACLSSRRIYVDQAIASDFAIRLHEYVGLLEVDDPVHASALLGPLGSVDAAKQCENRVVKSMREGARLVLGGFRFRPSGLRGNWLQPTILADVRQGALPMREEMAGPIITVSAYADDAELLAAVHDAAGPFGISLYGADDDELSAFAAPIQASAVWINLPQSDFVAPPLVAGSRPTYRPAYASGVLPDFYELDPLRIWSLT
jgi:acyl-CoA reductase-like NAD-dependent aldehyde dehydrogenase